MARCGSAAKCSTEKRTITDDVVENATRPDLIWDDQARGLCVRVYPDGSNSFIFLYHINGRQRFIRIGCSPGLSLKAAGQALSYVHYEEEPGRRSDAS